MQLVAARMTDKNAFSSIPIETSPKENKKGFKLGVVLREMWSKCGT